MLDERKHELECIQAMILRAEEDAQKQADGYAVRGYDVSSETFFWYFGSYRFEETPELSEALGLPQKYDPTHPRHMVRHIPWLEFKQWMMDRHETKWKQLEQA